MMAGKHTKTEMLTNRRTTEETRSPLERAPVLALGVSKLQTDLGTVSKIPFLHQRAGSAGHCAQLSEEGCPAHSQQNFAMSSDPDVRPELL